MTNPKTLSWTSPPTAMSVPIEMPTTESVSRVLGDSTPNMYLGNSEVPEGGSWRGSKGDRDRKQNMEQVERETRERCENTKPEYLRDRTVMYGRVKGVCGHREA